MRSKSIRSSSSRLLTRPEEGGPYSSTPGRGRRGVERRLGITAPAEAGSAVQWPWLTDYLGYLL